MRSLLLLVAIAVAVWPSLLWTAVVAVIMILVRYGPSPSPTEANWMARRPPVGLLLV